MYSIFQAENSIDEFLFSQARNRAGASLTTIRGLIDYFYFDGKFCRDNGLDTTFRFRRWRRDNLGP